MKTVLLRAPVLTQSGYGVHARQIARWLLSKNDIDLYIAVVPWGDTPWILNAKSHDGLIGKIFAHTAPMANQADVSIQLQLPNEWDPSLGKFNVGMTAGIETDRCNPEWVTACKKMNLIIVPSNHAKASLVGRSNLEVPVIVIPEAFTDAMLSTTKSTLPDFSTPFNFLIFGQLTGNSPETDRKNIFYTVKWLCETFKNEPDVGIVVKTNVGRNTAIDKALVVNTFQQLLQQVRSGPFPKVHLMHGDMADNEVAELYHHNQIKALVSLTRGEGFGLPILEAAACGLPIVTTGWSGHMDFMRAGKFTEVAYSLTPVVKDRIDGKLFMQGAQWAMATEVDFKKRILKFKESPRVPKEWALELKEKLVKTHNFEAIAKMYDEALGDKL